MNFLIFWGCLLLMLLQCSCSMPAAFTGCLKTFHTNHCVFEIEKFIIDNHIVTFKIHSQGVHRPTAGLQQACSVHRGFQLIFMSQRYHRVHRNCKLSKKNIQIFQLALLGPKTPLSQFSTALANGYRPWGHTTRASQ